MLVGNDVLLEISSAFYCSFPIFFMNNFLTRGQSIIYAPSRFSGRNSLGWGCSSAGRARRSQCRGQGFDPPHLHQNIIQDNPIKSRNPLEIAGFLLYFVQRRVIRIYKIHSFWVYNRSENIPKHFAYTQKRRIPCRRELFHCPI